MRWPPGDTAAVTWWRSQTTRRGLDALAERYFKDWAGDPSVAVRAEDTVAVQFVSASMLANRHASRSRGLAQSRCAERPGAAVRDRP